MARISDRDKEALRELMPDLLRILFGVENTARSFTCPLPDHEDSDPSAHYYADTHTVHCFGCGKTVDVFDLVGAFFGIREFPEKARKAAEVVGFRLDDDPDGPKDTFDAKVVRPPRPPVPEPRAAGTVDCTWGCSNAFMNMYDQAGGEAARQYLRTRGFDDTDIAHNGLGFTAFPKQVMREFSVFEEGSPGFVTIPFWEEGHRAARYCMLRTIPGEGDVRCKEWRPKGLAAPLWNEWLLTAGVDVLYVAEGLLDAMALHKMTDKPVVGLGGVSNAKRLGQVVYHAAPELRPKCVVVCLDDDEEGRKASDKLVAELKGMHVPAASLAPYPNGAKDPDEVLMAGRGRIWDFERFDVDMNGRPLYTTRWRNAG